MDFNAKVRLSIFLDAECNSSATACGGADEIEQQRQSSAVPEAVPENVATAPAVPAVPEAVPENVATAPGMVATPPPTLKEAGTNRKRFKTSPHPYKGDGDFDNEIQLHYKNIFNNLNNNKE